MPAFADALGQALTVLDWGPRGDDTTAVTAQNRMLGRLRFLMVMLSRPSSLLVRKKSARRP